MNVTSSVAARWSVSARATGEVLTASIREAGLQLVLLGVPPAFTRGEVEGWLADLAGVARETSNADARTRAIPALLHHSLTGLLFSHAELWSGVEPMPCSLAFVEHEDGGSFGWVGEATARVRVNGREIQPSYVRVRDDAGREAFALTLPAGVPVEVDLSWGRDAAGAPIVTLAADWAPTAPAPSAAPASPFVAPAPTPVIAAPAAPAPAPEVAPTAAPLEWPAELPQDQPSLQVPVVSATPAGAPVPAMPVAPPTEDLGDPASAHPVQRWLNRMVRWGRTPGEDAPAHAEPAPPAPLVAPPTPGAAPPGTPVATRPPVWRPDDAVATPAPPAPPVAPAVASPEVVRSEALPAASPQAAPEAEPAAAEPVAEPEPVREAPRDPEPSLSDALPRLRTKLLSGTPGAFEITHEPVGAAEGFAIPPLPGQASPAAEAGRSEGPPPLPATPDVRQAASGEDTLVIETHVGADREPLRREIAAQVRPAPRESFPAPSAPAPAMPFTPPAPLPPVEGDTLASAATGTEPAWAADPAAQAAARPRRAWPIPDASAAPSTPLARRLAPWGAGLVVLAAIGWWLGHLDNGKSGAPRWLKTIGLGGASYEVVVNSHPPGAWINVDGKDLGQRTPSTLDLAPGDHQIKLSMPDLGSATFPVKGARGDRTTLDLPLSGTLEIVSADPSIPLNVSLDGKPMGYAPVRVDSIAPGLHDVTFSGPGMPAWGQSVEVGIHQNAQLLARPVTSPGTGVIQVQAVLNDDTGSSPLSGASVSVDGETKGVTPLTLEVSRGPHSLKVSWHGTSAPVQVIDLPGGNQRFATFNFGLDEPPVTMSLVSGSRAVSSTQTSVVSSEITGLRPTEIREGWLHVRASEGVWRRYPLTVMPSPQGAVLVGVFPPAAFDADGRTRWYMSASTQQGDEYFTEIQSASSASAAPAPKPKPKADEQP